VTLNVDQQAVLDRLAAHFDAEDAERASIASTGLINYARTHDMLPPIQLMLSGVGGTGKTELLRQIRLYVYERYSGDASGKELVINCAPTGVLTTLSYYRNMC